MHQSVKRGRIVSPSEEVVRAAATTQSRDPAFLDYAAAAQGVLESKIESTLRMP